MLAKKVWILVVCVPIIASGGIFCGQHITSQEQQKVYISFSAEPIDPSKLNEWRWHLCRPLEDTSVDARGVMPADVSVSLSTLKAVEGYLRTTPKEDVYARVRDNYVAKHYKEYPDCKEHQAVLADAHRTATWFMADIEYMKKYWKLTTEFDGVENELISLLEKYNYRPAYEATHIPESERLKDIERGKFLMAEFEKTDERKDALEREEPIEPKPMHTH